MTAQQTGKTIFRISIICLIVLGIITYSLYQARNILRGPQISLTSSSSKTLTDPLVSVSGIAKNVTYLSLNDRQIYTDNAGNFNEHLLLSPGYNIWTIEAKDKFGRIVSKKIELVFRKN